MLALRYARRAAYDENRRPFGKCLRSTVRDVKAADAICDAHRPEPCQPGISIRGKTGALLGTGVNNLERTLAELRVEIQDVIALDAEDMPRSCFPDRLYQEFADFHIFK